VWTLKGRCVDAEGTLWELCVDAEGMLLKHFENAVTGQRDIFRHSSRQPHGALTHFLNAV